MRPLGLHHVSLNVDDVDVALAFFVEVLGLTARDDRPAFGFGGAWLDAGDQQVHLIEAHVPENRGQHLALSVEDVDAAVAEVRGHSTEVSDPSPIGTGRQAFLHDPSGNLIELHQPG